jgi:D-threo-aldose 1-dehydrogenase
MPFEPVYDYSYDAVMRLMRKACSGSVWGGSTFFIFTTIGRLTHGEENEVRMAELTKGGGLRALEELRAAKGDFRFWHGRE